MRPVVLQVFEMSLDGIIGEENTPFFDYCRALPDDPAYEASLVSSLERAGVHVMGRVTYEEMAAHFPTASGPIAEVMNRTPKTVSPGRCKPPTGPSRRSPGVSSPPNWRRSGGLAPVRSSPTAGPGSCGRWPGWTWPTNTG